MSKSIKGTQTEKNLLTSFAGESQARMRYTYFASVAKKEGYEQISAIFTETADQEKEHAKRMFKFLEGGMVEIIRRHTEYFVCYIRIIRALIPVHSATGFRPLFICNIISLVLRKALHRLWKHLESEAVFPNWQPVLSYDYIV